MEKTVYQGFITKVTEEEINGINWERTYLPSGVIIFPINDKGEILLVEERRPQETPNIRLKAVSGIIEEHETPEENAQREMQEEIGFKAEKMELFWKHKTTGTVNSTQYFYLAKNLTPSKLPNPDGEDTIIGICAFSVDEIYDLLLNEKMKWSNSTLGFWKLWQGLKENKISLT